MKDISIQNVGPSQIRETEGFSSRKAPGSGSFSQTLKESIQEINNLQFRADHAMEEIAQGKSSNLHETMILLEKADTSFRLMMQVRNKLLEAYHEIMRMQV
jgi:flagellar hook-basal body complex protein FliE